MLPGIEREVPRGSMLNQQKNQLDREDFSMRSVRRRYMKTASHLLRVVAGLFLLSTTVVASGFEITSLGAQARGMAGAFRAVANDWSAAYYNPAGYAYLQDNYFGVNAAFVHNRNELAPSYFAPSGTGQQYDWGHYNGRNIFNFHEILNNPSAGLVIRTPIWGETVFGLSIYQPFDYDATWKLYDVLSAYNRSVSLREEQYKNDLDIVAFQLTAGREFVPDKLSIGIGLQLLRAGMVFRDLTLRANPLSSPFSDRIWDKIPELSSNVGNGYGFGIRAGLMWRAAEKLRVGIVGAIPFEITTSGTTQFEFIMPDRASTTTFDNLAPGTVEHLFSNGGAVVFTSDFESNLKLPSSIGIGLAFDVTERLLFSLDAELTFWSQFEGVSFNYTNFDFSELKPSDLKQSERVDSIMNFFQADLSRPVQWDDAGKLMAGLRYAVSPTLTFVGGASLDQAPSSNFTDLSPQFFDTGDKFGLAGGILLFIDRWDLGLTTSYTDYPEETSSSLQDLDGDGIEDNFPGLYKGAQYETVLTINYRF